MCLTMTMCEHVSNTNVAEYVRHVRNVIHILNKTQLLPSTVGNYQDKFIVYKLSVFVHDMTTVCLSYMYTVHNVHCSRV